MLDSLSTLTIRAWLKPRETAPQLVQRFDLNTVAALYIILACVTTFALLPQTRTPLYLVFVGHLLAPAVFVLLAKWATKLPWIKLLKIALLGFVVTMPLSLLSNFSIVSPSPDGSNFVLLSILGIFYAFLTIWILVIQLRLYSEMLSIRKRTVFVIIMIPGLAILTINLLLLQMNS